MHQLARRSSRVCNSTLQRQFAASHTQASTLHLRTAASAAVSSSASSAVAASSSHQYHTSSYLSNQTSLREPALPSPHVSTLVSPDAPYFPRSPLENAAVIYAPKKREKRDPTLPPPSARVMKNAVKPKLISPLLSRIWRGSGRTVKGTLSPDDWRNVVQVNRQRILQYKESEQYHAWTKFQQMKAARLKWLEEKGEKPSAEMLKRIEDREAKIMQISAHARATIASPLPPMPSEPRLKSGKNIARTAHALAHPQTYLGTTYPNAPWRVFTFRLTHYHSHLLHKQQEKFRELAKKLGLSPSYPTYLPHKTKRFTIIRSPHVDKTSREQYETRLYSLQIHISPSPEKYYAIQRLKEIAFRLINGAVKMRIETPPNVPIESFHFAPNPLKAENGHTPQQVYATRDSPGLESISYKFDQHQFPFLADWEEEILDEQMRGIYPHGRDINNPDPSPRDGMTEEEIEEMERAQEEMAAKAKAESMADISKEEIDELLFDENGEFATEDDLVGEDESVQIQLHEDDAGVDFETYEPRKTYSPPPNRKRRF